MAALKKAISRSLAVANVYTWRMEPSEQFFGVRPDMSGKRVFWDQVSAEYPFDPSVHELASWMTHSGGEAEPEQSLSQPETSYRRMRVALGNIANYLGPDAAAAKDPQVKAALQAFALGMNVPPAILVHRAGVFDVANGSAQIMAAGLMGMPEVDAYVSESPHATSLDVSDEGSYGDSGGDSGGSSEGGY